MSNTVLASGDIDPNIKMPAAVKAASARSDQIFAQAYNTTVEGADAPQEGQQAQPDQIRLEGTPPAQQEPQQAQQEAPAPTQSGNEPDEGSWQHRYNSLKGRFDKQIEQIRAMGEQITALQGVVSQLNSMPAQTQTPAELKAEKLLSDTEVQEYGDEFLSVVGKKAKEELLPIIKAYESKIAGLEKQLQGVGGYVAQNARERMKGELSSQLPNWIEINGDPNFISWLQLPDPFSGAIRHAMLKEAWEQNHTPRVLAFFNGFLREEAATAPQNEPAPVTQQGKVPLETFAAPGRAKAAAATGPAEKPVITRQFITEHYAKAAAGKYRGRDAEYQRIEKQIADAVKDGRIR